MPYDVVICGGGLAGQTVARQLRLEVPEASVAVVDRLRRPLPDATFKVGESLVELSSHYMGTLLGLQEHFEQDHLHKNGLRFLSGSPGASIADRPEIGPAEFPIVPSYQIDRGRLETFLRDENEKAGVVMLEGEDVRDVELRQDGHRVHLRDSVLEARWVLDATGRRRLLQKKLGLREPSPQRASAAWLRVKDRVLIRELVPEEEREWHARDIEDNRWLSTVHLMGHGYWVWIIPLGTGYTSIGIVANHDAHDFRTFNTEARFRAWLSEHEPHLARRIEGVQSADFAVKHDYSYLASKVLSADRWATLGEAGFFLDPLYSLGNDFLSLGNCFAVRCIADDLRGELDAGVAEELDALILLLARDSSRTLSGNSRIFADANVLGPKIWWDFYDYWGYSCTFFFDQAWRNDVELLRRFRAMAQRWYDLNTHAQRVLEAWADLKDPDSPRRRWVPLPAPRTVLAEAHTSLVDERSPEETLAKMERDWRVGAELVGELFAQALRELGPGKAAELGRRLGEWELGLGADRVAAEELPRRQRLEKLPTVARDLERAVGRPRSDTTLQELLKLAGRRSLPDPVASAI